ncbi:MAG: response regulator [Candidatus Hydrogenedentes bacterium]|nr:response regulator [Candidatus Hydrogenedentota bacterium]
MTSFEVETPRILIVDDNPQIHMDFITVLSPPSGSTERLDLLESEIFGRPPRVYAQPAAYSVSCASQGIEAVELVRRDTLAKRPFAVAFVDMRMPPGIDGLETIARIWEHDPRVQCVLCTAYADCNWEEIINRLGRRDGLLILKKPFDIEEVAQLACALSQKWHLTQQNLLRMIDLSAAIDAQTFQLRAANNRLEVEVVERRKAEEALARLNETLLGFGDLPEENMAALIRLAVTLLECDWAVYVRNDGHAPIQCHNPGQADNFAAWERALNPFLNEIFSGRSSSIATQDRVFHLSDLPLAAGLDERAGQRVIGRGVQRHGMVMGILLADRAAGAPASGHYERVFGVIAHALEHQEEQLLAKKNRGALEEQLRQSQKMEALGHLSASIAHDFNNLLHAMSGYVSLAKIEAEENAESCQHMEKIESCIERGSTLSNQLLTFGRRSDTVRIPAKLSAILLDFADMLQRMTGNDVELILNCAEDDLPVLAAPNQIEQLLANFCINARDAMEDGGAITIQIENIQLNETHVARHPRAKMGAYVQLAVQDQGMGMEPELLQRILEPFFTTKPPGKGTGMGLAIAYGIIEQHEGFLEIDSAPSAGSTFRVYLPALDAP